VACEAVEGNHAKPGIEWTNSLRLPSTVSSREEIFFQGANFAERVGVVKNQQVVGQLVVINEVDLAQAGLNLAESWWLQARRGQRQTEWVYVVTPRHAPKQCGFHRCGAAAHEGIIDDVAGLSQALDEKARELGLKAGAIGDFVERTCLPLACGPELVDEGWSQDRPAAGRNLAGGLAEATEAGQFSREIHRPWALVTAALLVQSQEVGLGETIQHIVSHENNDSAPGQALRCNSGMFWVEER